MTNTAPQRQPAQQRRHADEEEVPRALEQLAPEVPGAGEAGQPVIQADHEADGVDRIAEHVVGREDVDHDEPDRRDHAERDRRDVRRLVLGVHAAEDLRDPTPACHREDVRAVGRIVVCVDADAEVSTVMIRSRLIGLGKTFGPRNAKMSLALVPSAVGTGVCLRRGRDHQVDQHQQHSAEHGRLAGAVRGVL